MAHSAALAVQHNRGQLALTEPAGGEKALHERSAMIFGA